MHEYFKGILKYPVRIIPLAVCGMILTSALSIYITIFNMNQMDEKLSLLKKQRVDLEWEMIEDAITESYTIAKKDAKSLALESEYSLISSFSNLDELEKQFDTYSYSEEFNEVLKEVLYEDQSVEGSFLTLVGTENHLVTMFSNNKEHFLKDLNSDTVVPWSKIIEMNINPKLAEDAINDIINRSDGVVFLQNSELPTNEMETIYTSDMIELENLYRESGIKSLNSFTLLAAAYITDTGDIFGVDDNTMLRENKNHKIAIVKSVDIEDIVDANRAHINRTLDTIDSLYADVEEQGDRSTLQSVLWSFILFLLSLLMIAVYNSEEKKGHLKGNNNDTNNEGGNDKKMRGE